MRRLLRLIPTAVALSFIFPGTLQASDDWITAAAPKDSECSRDKLPGKGVEARADFNGDGKKDVAKIQFNPKTKASRLAVWLNGERSPPVVLRQWNEAPGDDFVAVAAPRSGPTLCGRMGDCAPGEPQTLTLKQPGIAFGTCGSSEAIYYWDAKKEKFNEVWITD